MHDLRIIRRTADTQKLRYNLQKKNICIPQEYQSYERQVKTVPHKLEIIRDMISKHKIESWNRKRILVEKLVIR